MSEVIWPQRFSIAPMVDVTTPAFRKIMRVMTKDAVLYTEMVAAEALLHGKLRFAKTSEQEAPCVLQLGGCDPERLAMAARIGIDQGFYGINLNAGCPSDKVQAGNFGAALMTDLKRLSDCVAAMNEACTPVSFSVKTRIGFDHEDSEEFTLKLIGTIYESGCRHVIIHARKAWLKGLSPKENRTIPPLDYERVYRLKAVFPDLMITINGGITDFAQCRDHLRQVDGVMLGRAFIDNPYLAAGIDQEIYAKKDIPVPTRLEVMRNAGTVIDEMGPGAGAAMALKSLINLFCGQPGARLFRRYISDHAHEPVKGSQILEQAYQAMGQA